MHTSKSTYGIIGCGASGLHLAMAMVKNPAFKFEKLVIFEKKATETPEKTWSFWEKGAGNWDSICLKQWGKTYFIANQKTTAINLSPYVYKSLSAKDFIGYCKKELSKNKHISFVYEEVASLEENTSSVDVHTLNNSYTFDVVFDSRLPEKQMLEKHASKLVWQHFKGWFVEAEEDIFDEDSFTMMDYSVKDGEATSFMYILPFSKRKALLEFTYFSPDIVEESVYDKFIKNYIEKHFRKKQVKVTATEKGIIPMTNFPFEQFQTNRIVAIGTKGGWVKASSGYSFKHAEKKAALLVTNLLEQKSPSEGLFIKKYQHYDSLFLSVLESKNEFGEELFYRLYNKVPIAVLFRFLDEETSFVEDLRIITSLSSKTFIQAFFKHAKKGFNVHN